MTLPDRWWRGEGALERLAAEREEHGTWNAVAQAHPEATASAYSKAWNVLGGAKLPTGPIAGKQQTLDLSAPDDAWLLAALKKAKDSASVDELADVADVSPRRVREALERLGHAGFRVAEEDGDRVILRRLPPPSSTIHRSLFSGEHIRFGNVSDTHLCSKHERLEELHIAYDFMRDEGVTRVLHEGDLGSGIGVFKGQVNEIKLHTLEEQIEYEVTNYPQRKGMETDLIGGNHDLEGDFGKIGANPALAVCNRRTDMNYLGDFSTTIELEQGTRIYMLHPRGSVGYAKDYKIRKIAESFEGGEKPHVMLVGHWHGRLDTMVRGIQCLMPGCFESGGPYGARLGLSDPAVGFHIIDMTIADDGSVVRWMPTWYPFYKGRMVA
jgi:predicted phosphodiesterase